MMKIKEMHIVFENFEILKIPYQYVGQMRLFLMGIWLLG